MCVQPRPHHQPLNQMSLRWWRNSLPRPTMPLFMLMRGNNYRTSWCPPVFQCAHVPGQDAAAAAGAIEAVGKSLTRHATNPTVTHWACAAVRRLTDEHAVNQERAGQVGLAKLLVAALSAFPASDGVVEGAICALDNMLALPDNIPRVAAAGGRAAFTQVLLARADKLDDVSDALQRAWLTLTLSAAQRAVLNGSDPAALVALVTALPDDAALHAQAWARVRGTSFHGFHVDRTAQTAAAAAGAIEAVCTSLTRHVATLAVAKWACDATYILTENHTGNQERAGRAGVAAALVAAAHRWPTCRDVLWGGVQALDNLMAVSTNVARVATAGGRVVLTRALVDHPTDPDIQNAAAHACLGPIAFLDRGKWATAHCLSHPCHGRRRDDCFSWMACSPPLMCLPGCGHQMDEHWRR